MTTKVTDLGDWKEKRIVQVWEHHCGGQHFWLNQGGNIECVRCFKIISKTWSEEVIPAKESP